jgi:hypothetical protein
MVVDKTGVPFPQMCLEIRHFIGERHLIAKTARTRTTAGSEQILFPQVALFAQDIIQLDG